MTERFVNPYNFVHLPERPDTGPLADTPPATHAEYGEHLISGTIPITIRALTPILIPDQARAQPANKDTQNPANSTPKTVSTRMGSTGFPQFLGSSVKGMLRSYFEAITNSRLGVVSDTHAQPLAIRRPARAAVGIPAYVSKVDGEEVRVTAVWSLTDTQIAPIRDFLPAVWVPSVPTIAALGGGVLDGLRVQAWIHPLFQPPRGNVAGYHLWRVSSISKAGATLVRPVQVESWSMGTRQLAGDPILVEGILHWTGAKFQGKHDERLVVTRIAEGRPNVVFDQTQFTLGDAEKSGWAAVLAAYQRAHEDLDRASKEWQDLGGYIRDPENWKLKNGRTLFIEELKGATPDEDPVALHPAMIGREAFLKPPLAFFPKDHLPATSINKLSPAERVFGWTSPNTGSLAAHRGHVGVDPVVTSAGVTKFPVAMRLGALSRPKPEQYRFYLGAGDGRLPAGDGLPKKIQNGYSAGAERTIRGRKFYAADPALRVTRQNSNASEYWSTTESGRGESVDVGGAARQREYLPEQAAGAHVAAAIKDWVAPGTEFTTSVRVTNLSVEEVGALLWLLSLPEEAALRLGYGKPLGFGVTQMAVNWDGVQLRTGAAIRERYASLRPRAVGEALGKVELDHLVAGWTRLVEDSPQLMTIREDLLAIACGATGSPVKYPGLRWWTENEAQKRYTALPPPSRDPSLPS